MQHGWEAPHCIHHSSTTSWGASNCLSQEEGRWELQGNPSPRNQTPHGNRDRPKLHTNSIGICLLFVNTQWMTMWFATLKLRCLVSLLVYSGYWEGRTKSDIFDYSCLAKNIYFEKIAIKTRAYVWKWTVWNFSPVLVKILLI